MIFKPHSYQADCIDFLHGTKCAGVFADPGLGKTAIVLHLLERLWWESENLKALVIAPLRVCYAVWPAEIQKWSIALSYQVLHGDGRKHIKRDVDIHILNVENIFWLLERPLEYDVLVIDESSKFKNYSSKRFRLLKKHLLAFDRRIILTGTPAPNSLMDLYSQAYILDGGQALGRNITAYRKRFFYPTNYRNFTEWYPKNGADLAIQRQIAPLVQRIDASTHLDLPDLVYNRIEIELPPKVQKIYEGFEKQLFASIDSQSFVLINSAVAYGVCRQIANGRVYEPPEPLQRRSDGKVLQLHSLKVEALQELIGELQGKPLLVAYHYKHDLDQLLEAFGPDTPVIGGGVSAKRSADIIDQWNRGEIPLLLGHPQSMSHGINLQAGGNDVCWFSLTDNLEDYIQFNRRIYRQGVSGQVRIHHIIAKNTVDIAIMRRLQEKDKTQRALLNALEEYRHGI